MKTYKVYFRHKFKLNTAYFEAKDLTDLKWKVLSRFYDSTILKIVERS